MNTAIVGNGVIGQATANLFGIKKRYDRNPTKSNCRLDDVYNCEFIFICLPTPISNGRLFTDNIAKITRKLAVKGKTIVIIRSTVWPGFADSLAMDNVVSNPEFLSEDKAQQDIENPPFVLIGANNLQVREKVAGLYKSLRRNIPLILTDNISAEAGKLALNGFFSSKVIYANQIYDMCHQIGANYESVRKVLESHPFGYKNHADVWFKQKRGVRGRCLPKDLEGLANFTNLPLFSKLKEINDKIIGKEGK